MGYRKYPSGITRLRENLGRDDGIEEPYWDPKIRMQELIKTPKNSSKNIRRTLFENLVFVHEFLISCR